MSNFNEISSVDSKFEMLNNCYKDFEKLKGVRSKYENPTQK